MKKSMVGIMVAILSLFALTASAGACIVWGHQPKLPEALKK